MSQVKTLLAECSVASITLAAKGMVVGVEIAGTGALAGAQAAVEAAGGSSVAYASGSEQAAKYEVNVFFEQVCSSRILLVACVSASQEIAL